MSATKGRWRESHRPQASASGGQHADDGEDGLRAGEPGGGEQRDWLLGAAVRAAVQAALFFNAGETRR
jgi:hypothetical protein